MFGEEDQNYRTVLDWYGELRNMCSYWLVRNQKRFTTVHDGQVHCEALNVTIEGDTVVDVSYLNQDDEADASDDSDDDEEGVEDDNEGISEGPLPASCVEIDESYFGKKPKYNRGTSRKDYIVFGIVEKKGLRCVLHVIPRAKKDILLSLIKRHIDTSCPIVHDGLASYKKLHEEGYEHYEVNHSKCFKSSTGVHTNTIEGVWGVLKQALSSLKGLKFGCKDDRGLSVRLGSFLDEFSYRRFHTGTLQMQKSFSSHSSEALFDGAYWQSRKVAANSRRKLVKARRLKFRGKSNEKKKGTPRGGGRSQAAPQQVNRTAPNDLETLQVGMQEADCSAGSSRIKNR